MKSLPGSSEPGGRALSQELDTASASPAASRAGHVS